MQRTHCNDKMTFQRVARCNFTRCITLTVACNVMQFVCGKKLAFTSASSSRVDASECRLYSSQRGRVDLRSRGTIEIGENERGTRRSLSIYRFLFGEYIYLYQYLPTCLYSYLLPLCGSFIVKLFSWLLLSFPFACMHVLFRSSFLILPRGPARPIHYSRPR